MLSNVILNVDTRIGFVLHSSTAIYFAWRHSNANTILSTCAFKYLQFANRKGFLVCRTCLQSHFHFVYTSLFIWCKHTLYTFNITMQPPPACSPTYFGRFSEFAQNRIGDTNVILVPISIETLRLLACSYEPFRKNENSPRADFSILLICWCVTEINNLNTCRSIKESTIEWALCPRRTTVTHANTPISSETIQFRYMWRIYTVILSNSRYSTKNS